MAGAIIPGDAAIEGLRDGMRGELIQPVDEDDEHRSAVNHGVTDAARNAVARCARGADVISVAELAHEPGLLVSIRDVAGNFGVVTSYECRLHSLGRVHAGPLLHPVERAPEVLLFREFTTEAPGELTVETGFITDSEGDRLMVIVLCYAGDIAEGESVMEPVRRMSRTRPTSSSSARTWRRLHRETIPNETIPNRRHR